MPNYEKIDSGEIDLDWRKDEALKKESKWGGIVDFVDGHVDGYKLESVLRMGFFRIKAPVFADPFVKVQTLFVLLMVFVIATFFTITHKTNVMHVDATLVGQSSNIFGYFGGLSGFLFGFFIFDNLGTFLTVKNSYLGGFWGGFQELMALTGVWFPETDAKTTEFKKTIIRWGLATFALMCGAADPDCSEEESTGNAVRRGLLTTEEAELVTKMGGNAVVPLLWMFDVYEKNLAPKPGAAFKVNKIEDKILAMRGGVGGVLTAISSFGLTPLPLVHLMSALVKMQLFLLSIKEGVCIADIICGESSGKTPQILFSLLMAVSTPIIFQGLLEFVIMIRNPFGTDWVDFPTLLYHQQIRDEMLQYVTCGELAVGLSSVKAIKGIK